MPKAYWIANMDVHDAEKYDLYRAANAAPFAEYGAKFIVRGGPQEIREGTGRSRSVVIEFDSYAKAIACYESAGYQCAKDLRANISEGTLIIVEGYSP